MNDRGTRSKSAEAMARGVKNRMRFLMFAGMLAVALVFGLSFHFALLSNQSALGRQFPELEEIAAKLRGMLVLNTAIFAAIIAVSFGLLAGIVTSRLFQPLADLQRDLLAIADGKLPRRPDSNARGAFTALDAAWHAALGRMHEKESAEIKDLADCAAALSRGDAPAEAGRKLQDLLGRKRAFIGAAAHDEPDEKKAAKDPLFIQPV
jgi:methyl-accepting chemotaxis protein